VSTPLAVTLNTNDKFNIAVDGGSTIQVQVAAASYTTASAFLIAVNAAITGSALTGLVTAGWDATTGALTLTSATTGGNSSVAVSAVGGNTGMTHLGFSAGTNSGHQVEVTENTGYGVAGASFTAATPGSSGTAMSTLNAYGISNSGAFTFSALQYGSDKQALTFSATDANGTLETETITLQNNASVNRAGASIDDAVAYLNQQLQQTTANPALQKIVAVKQANAGGTAEAINFVSSLSNFTVGVAATANGDGLYSGLATYRTSAANGSGANMSIDTAAGAMAAITAIAAAIDKLGAAQATIGKGENQLTYAVNLAQSQITNFSAAESQIRDANVAQQAANLSKAQVLTQASIAAMAQANSAPQAVLTLLRG
jgi:flagellin